MHGHIMVSDRCSGNGRSWKTYPEEISEGNLGSACKRDRTIYMLPTWRKTYVYRFAKLGFALTTIGDLTAALITMHNLTNHSVESRLVPSERWEKSGIRSG